MAYSGNLLVLFSDIKSKAARTFNMSSAKRQNCVVYMIFFRYTEEAIEKNLCAFGKDNIMSTEDVFEKTRKCLAQSFKEMRNRKGS